MMDNVLEIILNFFAENYPIVIWMIVGSVITWSIMKLLRRIENTERLSHEVDARTSGLPCPKHYEDIKNFNNEHSQISKDVVEIQNS